MKNTPQLIERFKRFRDNQYNVDNNQGNDKNIHRPAQLISVVTGFDNFKGFFSDCFKFQRFSPYLLVCLRDIVGKTLAAKKDRADRWDFEFINYISAS